MERIFVLLVCLCSNLVGAQFGFYENQPRQDRRYESYDGFSQKYVPRQDRYRNQVSGTLHLRPENQNSNPAYIYPFDTRRRISNTGYYDQYGRYQQTQNDYGRQNYPQWQNYPDYGRPNYQSNQNYYGEYNNNGNKPVRFPTDNQVPNNNDPIIIVVEETDDGNRPASITENIITDQDTNGEYNIPDDKGVNFPPTDEKKNDFVGFPDAPANTETATLPPLTPVPSSEAHTEAPPFPPLPNDPAPAFTSPSANPGFPAFPADSDTDKNTELPPLQPVENSNPNNGFSSYKPDSPVSDLSPLQPVEPPNSNNGFSSFKPESPEPELTPLQPVENSNPNNGFSQYKPDSSDTNNGFSSFKPESPESELTPLQPVEASNPNNGFSSYKPDSPESELTPLKPVENSDPNNGFSSFKPESPESELTPLQPVENSNPNNDFSQYKPDSSDPNNGFSSFKPESPESELTPLQPVEASNTNNGFTPFKPQDLPPLQPVHPGDQTTLPPLTPVPPSELRNNFNFGPAGPFQPPCQTVEGGVGSCVSVFECPPYLARLQQSRSDPTVVQLLRRAHCGFDGNNPKVCCPRPGIPTDPPDFPTAPPTTTTTTTITTTTTPRTTSKPKSACPPETYSVGEEDRVPELPEPPVCGVSNASMSRVVGGVNASLGDFPFMALLGYRNARRSTSWLCGGSIVTSKHVLTAAHCIKCREDRLYVVRVGELDLSRDDEGATPVDVLIKSHVIHRDYDANSFTNDIGLLVLQQELQFTTRLIRPVCLPLSAELRGRTYERYTPIIAGWGDLHFRGPQSQQLQALQLPVVSNELCRQKYVKYKSQVIDERVLCAGYRMGGKDACQGDSGGPLVLPVHRPDIRSLENTYFYQIGVVSFGYKCAEPNFPGVYTRVTHFMPWLEEQLLPVR